MSDKSIKISRGEYNKVAAYDLLNTNAKEVKDILTSALSATANRTLLAKEMASHMRYNFKYSHKKKVSMEMPEAQRAAWESIFCGWTIARSELQQCTEKIKKTLNVAEIQTMSAEGLIKWFIGKKHVNEIQQIDLAIKRVIKHERAMDEFCESHELLAAYIEHIASKGVLSTGSAQLCAKALGYCLVLWKQESGRKKEFVKEKHGKENSRKKIHFIESDSLHLQGIVLGKAKDEKKVTQTYLFPTIVASKNKNEVDQIRVIPRSPQPAPTPRVFHQVKQERNEQPKGVFVPSRRQESQREEKISEAKTPRSKVESLEKPPTVLAPPAPKSQVKPRPQPFNQAAFEKKVELQAVRVNAPQSEIERLQEAAISCRDKDAFNALFEDVASQKMMMPFINVRGKRTTLLHLAASNNNDVAVRCLLQKQPYLASVSDSRGKLALHSAVQHQQLDAFNLLLPVTPLRQITRDTRQEKPGEMILRYLEEGTTEEKVVWNKMLSAFKEELSQQEKGLAEDREQLRVVQKKAVLN